MVRALSRRVIAALTTVLVFLACAAVPAFAVSQERADAATLFSCSITEEGAVIGKYKGKGIADVVVPETIDGHRVIGIADYAFADKQIHDKSGYVYTVPRSDIHSIALPNGLEWIGYRSFDALDALSSIVIPDTVTEMDTCAFWNCTSLGQVTISSGLTEIAEQAFEGCNLTSLVVPEGIRTIGAYAFSRNRELRSVQLPSTLHQIDDGAFGDCSSLSDINLPAKLNRLGIGALGSTSIRSCTIPASIAEIPAGAFMYCENLQTVTFEGSPMRIQPNAFLDCPNLGTVDVAVPETDWAAVEISPEGNEDLLRARFSFTGGYEPVQSSTASELTGNELAGVTLRDDSPFELSNVDGTWRITGSIVGHAGNTLSEVWLLDQFVLPTGTVVELDKEENPLRKDMYAVATGDVLRFYRDGQQIAEITVIVAGDVLGIGVMSLSQIVRMASAMSGEEPLEGHFLAAADFSSTGQIGLSDIVQEASLLRGPREAEEA